MRAPVRWLKDYVEFNEAPEILADRLTMAGIPVENIDRLGAELSGVVTARLTGVLPHPNADKLLVCRAETKDRKVTVVTGAQNVAEGDIVPLALPGAKLAGGKEIGETTFRGVLSEGMLCSADELFADTKVISPEEREGILILPPTTPVGVDALELLGLDDMVLEFELTANRADCFSVLGLAREVSVLTGAPVRKPMLNLKESAEGKANALFTVSIEEPALCPRFTGRIFRDVKIGPSPEWLKKRLRAAGMRPISNVVDVTNFVMLEMGQPMHAYDYDLVSRHTIIVRRAREGERLTTLDGVKRTLSPEMLVIADPTQAIGIAGVMGGLATEINPATRTVLLEAASFNGPNIRRTSRALGLRSEASGRFERGVDTAGITRALDRAAKLLEEMGAVQVVPGVIDNYPGMTLPRRVVCTAAEINAHLGTAIPAAEMASILKKLEFDVESSSDGRIGATVPSWRGDVSGMTDLSEEVARIYGYDRIPAKMPGGGVRRGGQSRLQAVAGIVRDALGGAGFDEIIAYSFTHPSALDRLNTPSDSPLRRMVEIMNPIVDDFSVLRTSLTAGVLETVVRNLSRKNDDMKVYEIGTVYLPETLPVTSLPREPLHLCAALTGRRHEQGWNQDRAAVDFFDAKGAAELVLERLGIRGWQVDAGREPHLHPGKTAHFIKNGKILATVGELHPQVADAFGIRCPVYLLAADVDILAEHAELISRHRSLPRFPAVARDLAVVLSQGIPAAEVLETVRVNGGPLLTDARLFDEYTGGQVQPGQRSLAFALTFRAADRTLTDDEVNAWYDRILSCLETAYSAKLRI